MKQIRGFEFHEQSWVPKFLHQCVTDYLSCLLNHYHIYSSAIPLLVKLIETTGYLKIIDFCSGSGGMLTDIQCILQQDHHLPVSIELTDKFPITKFIKSEHNSFVSYQSQSVDVLKSTQSCHAIRTLFTAFHHFDTKDAQRILKNAVDSNDLIAIFEFNERGWRRCLFDSIIPFSVLRLTPSIRPKSNWRLFFTYVVPILPLIIWWDGVISNLRTYSIEQLKILVANLAANNYHWEIGTVSSGLRFYRITYVLGWPKQESKHG